jgi:UDP-N-acetylmuramoyl-L-alanyl-D-glutamate--2,6-diaminopimelate ligase
VLRWRPVLWLSGDTNGLVGVTGTNGKTTTTHLIEHLLGSDPAAHGLLGTLYSRWPGHHQTALYTTPFAVDLQADLAAADAGCTTGVLEVSSHALAQKRVWGCPFEVAVFTNLTQDHLDYHKDLDDYFNAKALLFSDTYLQGRAVVNGDTPYGQRLVTQLDPAERCGPTAPRSPEADLYTSALTYQSQWRCGPAPYPCRLNPFYFTPGGAVQLENLLAAVGAALPWAFP